MALIRTRVDPPVARAPLYGLLDVATDASVDDGRWRTGVEYDSFACHQSKIWGEWCTGAGTPSATRTWRTVSVTLAGSRAVGDGTADLQVSVTAADSDPTGMTAEAIWDANAYVYDLTATVAVDGGPARQIAITVETQTDSYTVHTTTGASAVTVADDAPARLQATARITDLLTGTSVTVPVEQDATGGLLEPVAPIVFVVPEPGIPDGCFAVETTFTAAAAASGGGATITASATTTAAEDRELIVYVGGTRSVIQTGAAVHDVAVNVAPGTYRIGIRDVKSWSFVTGWLYVAPDFAGTAIFIQATCPVKDITTPPWTTLTVDPFTVYAEVACSTVGFSDAAAAARDALALSGPAAIERHYWESLIERAQAVGSGGAVDAVRAVAELEQYIASVYNGAGVIHTSPWGVAYLAAAGLLDSTATGDERLRTWRGTPIVVGTGYPREGSDDPATGTDWWMFVTGSISILRALDDPIEVVDYERNIRMAVAEETVAILDDCPTPGVVHVTGAGAP